MISFKNDPWHSVGSVQNGNAFDEITEITEPCDQQSSCSGSLSAVAYTLLLCYTGEMSGRMALHQCTSVLVKNREVILD